MKKYLMLVGLMLAGMPLITSCVDTKESASVENVRNSKAELNKANAQAAIIMANAEAEKIKADAQFAAAQAAYQQAQAEKIKAEAALIEAQVKAQEIANKLAEDMNNLKLQEEASRIQAQIAAYQSQIAAYEKQMQDYQNQMAEAMLRHQQQLLYLQQQLLQAQKDLENMKTQLSENEIQNYQYYAYQYYAAVQNVINLESEIAAAKLSLEQYKRTLETTLLQMSDNVAANVKYYNSLIEDNNKQIEQYKSDMSVAEAKLDILKNCEYISTGDLNALQIEIDAKQHKADDGWTAWNKAHDNAIEELTAAKEEAYANAYLTDAALKKQQEINELQKAYQNDPLYRLSVYCQIDVEDEDGVTYPYNVSAWNDIFNNNEWGTYRKTGDVVERNDTVAQVEYENEYGEKQLKVRTVNAGGFAMPEPCFPENISPEKTQLMIKKQLENYDNSAEYSQLCVNVYTLNAAAEQTRADQLKRAMELDSVKIDGKLYCDSIIRKQIPSTTYGPDTIKYVKAQPGEDVDKYSYYNLKNAHYYLDEINADDIDDYYQGYVEYLYQVAQNYRNFVKGYESALKNNQQEVAAFNKLIDMVENVATYQETLVAKFNKYADAYVALYAPYKKADLDLWYANNFYTQNDEEYAALKELNKEIDALWTAYEAMESGNNAIANAESDVNIYAEAIKNLEENNKTYEKRIEEAEANGKVDAEDTKKAFENYVATREANISLMENELETAKVKAKAYKEILDSLTAE